MMGRMLDNSDFFEIYDRERERELRKLPKCDECGEHIQDDHYYVIGNQKICPDCLEAYYRVENDD